MKNIARQKLLIPILVAIVFSAFVIPLIVSSYSIADADTGENYKMTELSIIHTKTLIIENNYQLVKSQVQDKSKAWPEMFRFDDNLSQIHYETEGPLIPDDNGKKPVLILLSNPHPHSVKQGMILSPNRIGKENAFWETMRNSGFFKHENPIDAPMMIRNQYQSPFRFFMAVLLPFPTEYPDDLIDIFGNAGYIKMMNQGNEEIKSLIERNNIHHVICFGKTQYDVLSQTPSPKNYTSILKESKIIQTSSRLSDDVKVFLTFPTGWRFMENAQKIKAENLRQVFAAIDN